MYRVELKVLRPQPYTRLSSTPAQVPNVPCGVESYEHAKALVGVIEVPNVPCGVESYLLHLCWVCG